MNRICYSCYRKQSFFWSLCCSCCYSDVPADSGSIGISIGVLIVLAVNKCRRSESTTLQTETEIMPPPVIYEDLDDIKPDPFTQGNVAYELVKPN